MYNAIADEENAIINSSRSRKCKNKVVGIFRELQQMFVRSRTNNKTDDERDDKTDDTIDDEQPGATDMPDLENEGSAEQRKHQEGQGLKH